MVFVVFAFETEVDASTIRGNVHSEGVDAFVNEVLTSLNTVTVSVV
jgi:hypothetical protein